MRLLYKPFGIIGAIIASLIGRKAFDSIWAKVDDAPTETRDRTEHRGQGDLCPGARASVMAASAAAVDRVLARGFHYAIGIWPKKPPKVKDDNKKA